MESLTVISEYEKLQENKDNAHNKKNSRESIPSKYFICIS